MRRLEVLSPDGVGEVGAGDDVAGLLLTALRREGAELLAGDVVVVTSKVVSKAEGRVRPGERDAGVDDETVRVVARRGPTRIVRTRHGLTMAAAGVDASNVAPGHVALLPADPDASARRLRAALSERTGVDLGVVVTDTAGRAWREGQTDIAVGAAGLVVLDDHSGRTDGYGNPLSVTAPAVADEIAGVAELASGKLAGRPFAILRGRGDLVLPLGEDGPGAASLVRPERGDLFGYGAREAVVRALAGDPAYAAPFGSPAETGELLDAARRAGLGGVVGAGAADAGPHLEVVAEEPGQLARLRALALAHGWELASGPAGSGVRLRPRPVGP